MWTARTAPDMKDAYSKSAPISCFKKAFITFQNLVMGVIVSIIIDFSSTFFHFRHFIFHLHVRQKK